MCSYLFIFVRLSGEQLEVRFTAPVPLSPQPFPPPVLRGWPPQRRQAVQIRELHLTEGWSGFQWWPAKFCIFFCIVSIVILCYIIICCYIIINTHPYCTHILHHPTSSAHWLCLELVISCHDSKCWWLQLTVHGNDGSHRICQVYRLGIFMYLYVSLILFNLFYTRSSVLTAKVIPMVCCIVLSLPSMLYICTERQLLSSDYTSSTKVKSPCVKCHQISAAFCVNRRLSEHRCTLTPTKSTKNHQHSLATPSEPLNSPVQIRARLAMRPRFLRCFSEFVQVLQKWRLRCCWSNQRI